MRRTTIWLAACAAAAGACAGVRDEFANPPPESRLQAWYHWTTTGITDECLAADLKAMGELGVGTAHVFMPGQQGLPPDTQPLSDEWWKRWETAIREAKKNNIRLGFHNCPGWSSSGGKWIKPEDSMKVLVAAATDVADLSHPVKLAQPTAQHGFYRDIAVYAFPIEKPAVPEKVTGDFTADFEAFRRGEKPLAVPIAPEDKGGAVVFEYARPIMPTSLVTCWNESQFYLDLDPTKQGKDLSSRARRRKRGSPGCVRDPRASSRVEAGMSGNFLSCSKGVKDPLEVPVVRCD